MELGKEISGKNQGILYQTIGRNPGIGTPFTSRQIFNWLRFTFFIYRETFGESLNWAGMTLIMLLRQEHRFEALDFCNHIIRVQEIDSRQEVVAGVVSSLLLSFFRILCMRSLYNSLFLFLFLFSFSFY